jgi:hypothetical protein
MSRHAVVSNRRSSPRLPVPRTGDPGSAVPLSSLLPAWVAEQLITAEQADRILARGDRRVSAVPARPEPHHPRSSLVIEALGYLGGVIMVVASFLIASMYWDEIGTTGRLSLVGAAAAVLLAAGFAIPDRLDDVGVRLRSVLWLGATGAFAGFAGLLGADVLDVTGTDLFLLVSSAVAVFTTGLWLVRRSFVQQAAMMVSLILTASALADRLTDSYQVPGYAVWTVALVWTLLGWRGLLEPRRLAMGGGAAGMFFGAMMALPSYPGITLGLLTAVTVVAAAVALHDLLLLAVGALGTLMLLPAIVMELFPGTLAAPIAMLVVGAMLVATGLYVARQRRTPAVGRQ